MIYHRFFNPSKFVSMISKKTLRIFIVFVLFTGCDKREIVLKAECDFLSVAVMDLTLYSDSTYCINYHTLTNSIYKGTYHIRHDTLLIEDFMPGTLCLSKEWIIKDDTIFFYTFFPKEKDKKYTDEFWIISESNRIGTQ
ncbi:MAG: hypothetical protein LBU57_01380 [Dysgonamonadaceae bacterium]|jgi:hypothetical protein|nr:hypothetical protein [Dysgonamonadaceae bacterium]